MKKTVILILAVLPIVLLVVIAFAGQILSYYQHISVERVEFVDRFGTAYGQYDTFTLEQGGPTKETIIQIYPELATNKNVTYTSQDPSICDVDQNGVLKGIHFGTTTIVVKTDDGSRTAMLNVEVTADTPFSVTLSEEDVEMIVGESHLLGVKVDAPVAVNKNVTYFSDNPGVVLVDAQGKLTALSEGEATITVTTVLGGKTDTCTVTVVEGIPPLSFDLEGISGVDRIGDLYVASVKEIDVLSALRIGEGINPDDVKLKIQSGNAYATLVDGVLTLSSPGVVTVRAYIGDEDSPTKFEDLTLTLKR